MGSAEMGLCKREWCDDFMLGDCWFQDEGRGDCELVCSDQSSKTKGDLWLTEDTTSLDHRVSVKDRST